VNCVFKIKIKTYGRQAVLTTCISIRDGFMYSMLTTRLRCQPIIWTANSVFKDTTTLGFIRSLNHVMYMLHQIGTLRANICLLVIKKTPTHN